MTVNAITDFKFFTGGNAYFTVSGPKGHFTFRIRAPKSIAKQGRKVLFCHAMTGSDNESHYSYLGIMRDGQIHLTNKSKFGPMDQRLEVVNWALRQVLHGRELPEGYAIQHEGRCCVCARKLTNPESISSGIGPECAKRS
jgi:hypothetical protein